jgi:excinuclease ABC subunit B
MYADTMTDSMRRAIGETQRRRRIQAAYNEEHGITPQSVKKALSSPLVKVYEADYVTVPVVAEEAEEYLSPQQLAALVEHTRKEMKAAAAALEFEKAAELRDRLQVLEQRSLGVSSEGVAVPVARATTEMKPVAGKRAAGAARGRSGAGKAAARSRTSRWQK